jgi:SAM-dependent methyltransferase
MPQSAFKILQDTIEWQKDVWNRISWRYLQEIDPKFQPVTDEVMRTANLKPGENVLDLGCGTGAATLEAARAVLPGGTVTAVDISAQMLLIARMRLGAFANVKFEMARAKEIPEADASQDVVLSSLVLMFAIDKAAAAREIARVLRPGGRIVASVWDDPEHCDIARFQKTIGKFAPPPPTRGVGPTSLADPTKLMMMLAKHGIATTYHSKTVEWEHPSFDDAWETFAIVTSLRMSPEQMMKARAYVLKEMWGGKDGPRTFRNSVHYIVGRKKT